MPDVFANITAASPQAREMIANVLELRASIAQQQEMLRTYLRDIDFPDRAKVLEIGCGTGSNSIAAGNIGIDVGKYCRAVRRWRDGPIRRTRASSALGCTRANTSSTAMPTRVGSATAPPSR